VKFESHLPETLTSAHAALFYTAVIVAVTPIVESVISSYIIDAEPAPDGGLNRILYQTMTERGEKMQVTRRAPG